MVRQEMMEDMMKKDVNYYMNLPYIKEVIPQNDGGFIISVKEFNRNCMVEADTIKEGFEELKIVMKDFIEIAIEDGVKIPLPKNNRQHHSGKLNLRLPIDLHDILAESAEKNHVSLNTYIISLLAKKGYSA